MKLKSPYLVPPHSKVRLSHVKAGDSGHYRNKDEASPDLEHNRQRLDEMQELLTADSRYSILVVLQGMDTAGKDGTVRHIFTGVNPEACNVTPFKVPTAFEKAHDYLWRAHRAVPAAGTIGIFNRSHYEDVLVPRVHKQLPADVIRRRLKEIVEFEQILADNHVVILKFFLHITREEQTSRLESRLADPDKHWKISESDFQERAFWSEYQKAYEDAISATSRHHAPWFIIPANHKWFRNVAISSIMVDAMKGLKMKYPKASFDIRKVKL